MEAYLDNSATTRVIEPVRDVVVRTMTEDYGNPSSLHRKGFEAESYIKTARMDIAKTLKAQMKEIYFTSGGTESNNMAIIGAAMANKRRGNHIITTTIEQASVYNVFGFLENEGFRVSYVPVDEHGHVRLDELEKVLDDETILVSAMYVNNEIGSVNPIAEIGTLIKKKVPHALFHVDAIQAYGKFRLYPQRMGIDLLSVSGHKIHGPKGTGFLYIREGTKVRPLLYGGGQQNDMRSGTDNVPGVAGLGVAAVEMYTRFEEKIDHLYQIKELFIREVETLEGTRVNGLTGRDSAPHIVSVSFEGVRSEVLLHSLEERKVYVSSGSACSSNHPAVSGTLQGIGVEKKYLDSTLRFSFSTFTTEEEICYAVDCLRELLPVLRRYSRR